MPNFLELFQKSKLQRALTIPDFHEGPRHLSSLDSPDLKFS